MKRFAAVILLPIFLAAGCGHKTAPAKKDIPMLTLTSPEFANGATIPVKYSCKGQNINPPLEIAEVPEGTKSLALIVDDPDVPKNLNPDGLFVHWVLFNMEPQTSVIAENSVPAEAAQGSNGRGESKYTGPCPPDREHRYFFKLYALNAKLNLPSGASKDDIEKAMQGHILQQTEYMGKFWQ